MTIDLQTIAALLVVAVAAGWLIVRSLGKRKGSGCGGTCACPTEKLKR